MSLTTTLQQNDIGITFTVTVTKQDGVTSQDISSATSLIIYLIQPDGSVITGSASFVNTGTDGQMQYISQTGDLYQVGIYKIQGEYMVGGNTFYTEKTQFLVESNF